MIATGCRPFLRWFGLLVLIYILTYGVLSITGGWVVAESGEARMHLAVADIFVWQPRHGSCQKFRTIGGDHELRADTLGYLYAPLILLDQSLFHPTIRFLTSDLKSINPMPAPALSEYHPLRTNPWQGRYPYQ